MTSVIMEYHIVLHFIQIYSVDFETGLHCVLFVTDILWHMSTLYFLFMAMNNYLIYIHMDLQCNSDWQPCVQSQYEL
jgi:hypothetical protein